MYVCMYVCMYVISPLLKDIPAFHPPLPPRGSTLWGLVIYQPLILVVWKGDYSTHVLDYYAL